MSNFRARCAFLIDLAVYIGTILALAAPFLIVAAASR